jgi:hypothetical protein
MILFLIVEMSISKWNIIYRITYYKHCEKRFYQKTNLQHLLIFKFRAFRTLASASTFQNKTLWNKIYNKAKNILHQIRYKSVYKNYLTILKFLLQNFFSGMICWSLSVPQFWNHPYMQKHIINILYGKLL